MNFARYSLMASIYLLSIFSICQAAPVDSWFSQANKFYEEQQYDSAITYYQRITESGVSNSAVFFNLGNAYFRTDKIGLAILNYEKAKRLAPDDSDIEANIHFANMHTVDRTPVPQRSFLASILWRLHTLFSLKQQLWVLFAILMLSSIMFSFSLFAGHNVRLWLIYGISLSLLFILTLGVSVGIKIHERESVKYAVVLHKAVDAVNQPRGSKVLFNAHEGTRFRIRKRQGSWVLVSLPNGASGWVNSEALGEI